MDNGNYLSAFEVMNYVYVLIGAVDIDDSAGDVGVLADGIYELWLTLLVKVSPEDKKKMFDWFTTHLDQTIEDVMYGLNLYADAECVEYL